MPFISLENFRRQANMCKNSLYFRHAPFLVTTGIDVDGFDVIAYRSVPGFRIDWTNRFGWMLYYDAAFMDTISVN